MSIFEKVYIIKFSKFHKFTLKIIERKISEYFRVHKLCIEF